MLVLVLIYYDWIIKHYKYWNYLHMIIMFKIMETIGSGIDIDYDFMDYQIINIGVTDMKINHYTTCINYIKIALEINCRENGSI